MKINLKSKAIRIFLFIVILLTVLTYLIIWKHNFNIVGNNKEITIEISKNDNIDSVISTLSENGNFSNIWTFRLLSKMRQYDKNIMSGTLKLTGSYNNYQLINHLRQTRFSTINIRIPENIRKIDDMITLLEDSIGFKKNTIKTYLDTSNFLSENNLTIETLPAFLIPNTYEIYKNITVSLFFQRMKTEYQKFWNKERSDKCKSIGLSKIEVAILASIVEEEQDKRIDERPDIAGLYLNRLNNQLEFPYLQADPTVKFANDDFSIKQVLNIHLSIDNPYNTYKYTGLPPGPICIPSINALESVLNATDHDYYFMCAGSNGDGYHKFTSSNKEHNINKIEYKKFQNLK